MRGDREWDEMWSILKRSTNARIGLGRIGSALPTAALLEFQMAHALARDAVHRPLDVPTVCRQLGGHETIAVSSRAHGRATYLTRPDLGRRLCDESISDLEGREAELIIVLADGLSARAAMESGVALVHELCARLQGWNIGPLIVATQARVALGDEIAALFSADLVVTLIGERPGLSAADSLGAYLTWKPRVGRRDDERNCVSNIRPGGLEVEHAASRIIWLANAARGLGLTGVGLKDGYVAPDPLLPHASDQ